MNLSLRYVCLPNALRIVGWWVLCTLAGVARGAEPTPEGIEFFEKHVRPVLVNHCAGCHGEKKQEAGLRLDRREPAMAGGDRGPVIVPGDPSGSRLIEAIGYA